MNETLAFEVIDKDLLGRIGRLKTKSGTIETPLLLPVVNPLVQPVSPREMERDYACQAIIANAYLLKKNFGEAVKTRGLHDFLEFHRVVMTDSGAYQILVHGDVAVTPLEIVQFQEEIGSDIAVMLDVPTGWNVGRERAQYTVDETLRRARSTLQALTRKDILWVGPIQGGNHLDLVAFSAAEIGALPFQMCGLGSPTQVLERYLFNVLVDMVMTAKKHTALDRPFHLFGAGHPFMFSFAVAMGCDTFDSAAYALYARQDKYLTDSGTVRLRKMEYFPCSCAVCAKHTPKDLREMPSEERAGLLTRHNLFACFTEIRRIKQAIREGRLWELLDVRSRSHPALLTALKGLRGHRDLLEASSPTSKNRGIFFFDAIDLARPPVLRYQSKLKKWHPPGEYTVLVLVPQTTSKPFHRSREFRRIMKATKAEAVDVSRIHFCVYATPFGVVPIELDEVYPLSQCETSVPADVETEEYVITQVTNYIREGKHGCKVVVLYSDDDAVGKRLLKEAEAACIEGGLTFLSSKSEDTTWSKDAVNNLMSQITLALTNRDINDGAI